jgi:transcriptional regulator with XRE-family HTH domain
MKPSEIQQLFNEEWNLAMNKMVMKRQDTNYTQQNMADLTGRSLKTINNFENGKSLDAALLFGYRLILEGKKYV